MNERKLLLLIISITMIFSAINSYGEDFKRSKNIDENNRPQFFEKYFFVGFAEIYSGINKNNGDTEIIEDTTDYKEHYTKGRINLFLRGKIKGKYLLTAWLDTDENELKNLFSGLTDREVNTIFEKIDPEEYYPVYGDDSQKTSLIATSGKLYIALESEKFNFLWGNYKINFDENELISFDKKLYGLNSTYKNDKFGYNAFLYNPYSLPSIDNIKSTGGMLYYLKHDDLIIDSEIIKVELRDSTTNRVLKTTTLTQGEDYEISYSSGRIILTNNIDSYFSNSMIESSDGYDNYYLVATYEYEPSNFDEGTTSYGLEISYKINNENKLTGNYIKNRENNGETYEVYGLDWSYDSEKTKIKTGYALSFNELSENYISDDGGLNYIQQIVTTDNNNSDAWNIEIERNIGENKVLKTYYKYLEDGFSSGNDLTNEDETNYGIELIGNIYNGETRLSYDKKKREYEDTDLYGFARNKKKTEKLTLKSEFEYEVTTDKEENNNKETDLTGAVGFSYQLKETQEIYGSQQLTIDSSENDYNNITKLGTKIDYKKWRFDTEGGLGNQQNILKIKTGYMLNEKSEIYTGVERTFDKEDGIDTKNIVGTKAKLNEKTNVYTEYQTEEDEDEMTRSNVFGVDYIPAERWLLSLDYTKSNVDENDGGYTDRDIVTTGVHYRGERLREKLKAEYRKDKGDKPLKQKIFTTDMEWKQNESLRYILEADYDKTTESGVETEKYVKGSFGFAYRPITHDRLNLLSKYTYFERVDADAEEDEYQGEKANVFALESIYDITGKWQIGEKVGYKRSKVRLVIDDSTWYESNTWLYILKLSYKVVKSVEITGEYKYLTNDLAEDNKDGIQAGVYKRFENHLKLGLGYNFAEFNDDLTNLDYKSEGMFINVVKAW